MTLPEVLDLSELTQLGEQLGDPGAVHRFIDRYAGMLPRRVQRLGDALAAKDLHAWDDAALSLRTSSAMVGALRLSHMVAQAQAELVRRGSTQGGWPDGEEIQRFMGDLSEVSDLTERQLRAHLEQPGQPSGVPETF